MANRFPLIVDSSALQIKEIPANDNLDLANNSIVNVVDITASGNISVGGTLTYQDVTNIDAVGIITARAGIKVLAGGINAVGVVTATTFSGSGANLTALNASNLASGTIPDARFPATLPAINGSALTGIISGVGIATAGGYVGSGATTLKFIGAGVSAITTPSAGVSTIHITGGGGGGSGQVGGNGSENDPTATGGVGGNEAPFPAYSSSLFPTMPSPWKTAVTSNGYYGGGGGGGSQNEPSAPNPAGGNGGGERGGTGPGNALAGVTNTGSGGGGGGRGSGFNGSGEPGGPGIVIIRYLTP